MSVLKFNKENGSNHAQKEIDHTQQAARTATKYLQCLIMSVSLWRNLGPLLITELF